MNDDNLDPDPDPAGQSPLDDYLSGALAGHGKDFEVAGQKYGVDPKLLASIAMDESDHGRSHYTTAFKNPMGMMDPNSQNQTIPLKYNSLSEGIDAAASTLSRKIEKGLSTIPQLASEYSPVGLGGKPVPNDRRGTNKDWPGDVTQIYKSMGGDKARFGPQPVGAGVNMMGGYSQPPPPSPNLPASDKKDMAPPPDPTPVAEADSDSDSFAATHHLGGHLGAINA